MSKGSFDSLLCITPSVEAIKERAFVHGYLFGMGWASLIWLVVSLY